MADDTLNRIHFATANSARRPRFSKNAPPLANHLNFPARPPIFARMKAKVIVMPKRSVLDPQGVAVRDAIHHHGLPEIKNVRIGKFMEIEIDGTAADGEKKLHEICRDLLSNPVIEDYELEILN
jgi:phosphoribosylformylglycinamidine synthase subunit PurS